MEFVICKKHNKSEKSLNKANVNGYVCMNRYCPDSFRVICDTCKKQHQDHTNRVLTIEDTKFLLERLMKVPFKENDRHTFETRDVMKKLKLIKGFSKKIDIIEKETQRQALKLVKITGELMEQYNQCCEKVTDLNEIMMNISKPEIYDYFLQNSQHLLSNLDYNFKKDCFEYGNPIIKERDERKRKVLDQAKRKIEEVRDYSLKIVEVILQNLDSDEEDRAYTKKHYQSLRDELFQDKNEEELEEEIEEMKNSKATSVSRVRRISNQQESQTPSGPSPAQIQARYEQEIRNLKLLHQQNQETLQKQLQVLAKEKEELGKELSRMQAQFAQKNVVIRQIEQNVRKTRLERQRKQRTREQLVKTMANLWEWKGLSKQDRQD